MKLQKVTKQNFDILYNLMENDFCFEERRIKENHYALLSNKEYKPYFIKDVNNNILGYICYWEFNEFIFIEHFAIIQSLRNQGIGINFLQSFISKAEKKIIFEIEKPIDTNTKRRFNFYKRLGAKVINKNYLQPSYHGDDNTVPMYLLCFGNITKKESIPYLTEIKTKVYNIKI